MESLAGEAGLVTGLESTCGQESQLCLGRHRRLLVQELSVSVTETQLRSASVESQAGRRRQVP